MKPLILIVSSIFILLSCQNKTEQKAEKNEIENQKALIKTYFKHFNAHDWPKMASMYTPKATFKDPAFGASAMEMTQAEVIKKYQQLEKMIPDVRDSVVAMYHSGNNVILEFETQGTGPDGKDFKLPICTIFEITNGKISKDLTYYDNF